MSKMASESHLQKAVATYLDFRGVLWCHVANERKTRSKKMGGYWVGQGVKSGVPDCLIFEPSKHYAGLAIELKNGKGKRVSPNQKTWLSGLQNKNWRAEVAYSFEEAIEIIESYLAME